jgi:geranylgeranyl pyrophosphate synthase
MSRSAYFEYLEETASLVGPFLEKVFRPYREQHEGLYNELMLFAGSRLRRPLQKPALFRLVYELCGGKDWEKYLPVAAAFELLNISSYQANASFDNKLGTITDEQKDAQFICAMISREIATTSMRKCKYLSCDQIADLEASLSKINHHIYQAQYLDMFVLTTAHLDRYENDEVRYLKDYFSRCHLGSGLFNSEICYWAGKLASHDDDKIDSLRTFGDHFGTGLHLINDLGDYAPIQDNQHNYRDYQDRYSDFRNGRLTIVLYYLLTQTKLELRTYVLSLLSKKKAAIEELSVLSQMVYEHGAMSYTKKHAKLLYFRACDDLASFRSHSLYPMVLQLVSILRTNKFNTSFRNVYGGNPNL